MANPSGQQGKERKRGLKCIVCLMHCVVLSTLKIFPLLIPLNSPIKKVLFSSFFQMKTLRLLAKLSYIIQHALDIKPILSDSEFPIFLPNYGFLNSIHWCPFLHFHHNCIALYFYLTFFFINQLPSFLNFS